jgi:hypothetical protein
MPRPCWRRRRRLLAAQGGMPPAGTAATTILAWLGGRPEPGQRGGPHRGEPRRHRAVAGAAGRAGPLRPTACQGGSLMTSPLAVGAPGVSAEPEGHAGELAPCAGDPVVALA